MCGRFTLALSPEAIASLLELNRSLEEELGSDGLKPRFNIAPGQDILAATVSDEIQERELRRLRWGLVPSWAKDPAVGNRMINARSESVATKPAFREAFSVRRCLIPADGFFEWQKIGHNKQPWHFKVKSTAGFAMAGLWELWRPPEGPDLATCTILTTSANALVGRIHERMPVILDPDSHFDWLDPRRTDPGSLQKFLKPLDPDEMTADPVDPRVNSPSFDEPACIEAIDEPGPAQTSLF
jgi:putative SOS response-associated peptidase YedK